MKVAQIALPDSRFYLKSEYGPLSIDWPVVAVTTPASETIIRRNYRSGRDFIVYLGTQGEETPAPDRGRLLSIVEIDTTRVYNTYEYLSDVNKKWAEERYPNKWLRGFRAVRGFDIPSRPEAAIVLPDTDRQMWHVTIREIVKADRNSFDKLDIDQIEGVDILNKPGRTREPLDLTRPENALFSQEAVRLAQLVFNRVRMSGEVIQSRAPERSSPTNLQLQILALLLRDPLLCALCGSKMCLPAPNKLLQISGDRRDSALGDYGPNNYQLVHLACNLAKNNGTDSDFRDWLNVVRDSAEIDRETLNG